MRNLEFVAQGTIHEKFIVCSLGCMNIQVKIAVSKRCPNFFSVTLRGTITSISLVENCYTYDLTGYTGKPKYVAWVPEYPSQN